MPERQVSQVVMNGRHLDGVSLMSNPMSIIVFSDTSQQSAFSKDIDYKQIDQSSLSENRFMSLLIERQKNTVAMTKDMMNNVAIKLAKEDRAGRLWR